MAGAYHLPTEWTFFFLSFLSSLDNFLVTICFPLLQALCFIKKTRNLSWRNFPNGKNARDMRPGCDSASPKDKAAAIDSLRKYWRNLLRVIKDTPVGIIIWISYLHATMQLFFIMTYLPVFRICIYRSIDFFYVFFSIHFFFHCKNIYLFVCEFIDKYNCSGSQQIL